MTGAIKSSGGGSGGGDGGGGDGDGGGGSAKGGRSAKLSSEDSYVEEHLKRVPI